MKPSLHNTIHRVTDFAEIRYGVLAPKLVGHPDFEHINSLQNLLYIS
jgi:hypothetical protein